MENLAFAFKALSEPVRLRAMRLLVHGELCICDLMNGLDLPQSTVSRHMSILKSAGWVAAKRKGQWVYYSLAAPGNETLSLLSKLLKQYLPDLPQAKKDYARLTAYLATKEEDKCATETA